jgi:hypothetical protein
MLVAATSLCASRPGHAFAGQPEVTIVLGDAVDVNGPAALHWLK